MLEWAERRLGLDHAEWGVDRVICQEKHMGSRAVVFVRPADGAVYTRTGRTFLGAELTSDLLDRVRAAVATAGLNKELGLDWLLLDAELLPWSAKAGALLREQYAPVGAAAAMALPPAAAALRLAAAREVDRGDGSFRSTGGETERGDGSFRSARLEVGPLLARTESRLANASAYDAAWQRYVWPTSGLDGVQLAVFQVLAAEGASFAGRDHQWHLAIADRLVEADPVLFRTTRRLEVDVDPRL
ncbi:MAG: hypothetical protein QM695_14400 [Micropruina sp.]